MPVGEHQEREEGEWFYDSLIRVNEILRQEAEQGIARQLRDNPSIHAKPRSAARLARVYGDCYHFRRGGYTSRLRVKSWLDRETEHERLSDGWDVTIMVSFHNDVWPRIVAGFGLFPKRYERKEQTW